LEHQDEMPHMTTARELAVPQIGDESPHVAIPNVYVPADKGEIGHAKRLGYARQRELVIRRSANAGAPRIQAPALA
jgi:hypothetical protein